MLSSQFTEELFFNILHSHWAPRLMSVHL